MTKDKIEAYYTAQKALLECFGLKYAEYIEDNTPHEWMYSGSELHYLNGGDEYSFDSADLIDVSEGYELYYVFSNGDRYYTLFHSDKKITDEDEIEEKFDW